MDSRFGFRFSSGDVRSGSSLTVGERLCAVFFPLVAIAEAVFFALTDCLVDLCPSSSSSRRMGSSAFFGAKKKSYHHLVHRRVGAGCASLDFHYLARLADESRCFSVNEVEALFELYKKISCSIIDDGLIHKRSGSSLTVGERLCAVFFPLVAIAEAVFFALTDCFVNLCPSSSSSRRTGSSAFFGAKKKSYHHLVHRRVGAGCASLDFHYLARLADESRCFSVNEVEALFELYKKINCSIIDDGLIHKEELQLALFKAPSGENLFLDRVFYLFDEKKNGVIEFDEFIHALSVFHPFTPLERQD